MTISSPCIRVCILDPETGLCEGCGRTTEEIARWFRMSEAERLAIMATLPERERLILRLRFEQELTQAEIGRRLGVSQMHVSRLIRKSIARLQQASEGDPLTRM